MLWGESPAMDSQPTPATDVEIDFRALLGAIRKRLPYLIVFILIVAIGTYGVLSRVASVYKSETTLRARDFARWFWFTLGHDSELVCLETDWKRGLSLRR